MISGLKSISQIHRELVDKKHSINKIFDQLNISNIPQNQDYQTNNLTFTKIFNMIPSEDKLKDILDEANCQQQDYKANRLSNYRGPYEIVEKAAKRVQELKADAKDIYFLFSELNLPKINDQFKKAHQMGKVNLQSFEIINSVQSNIKQQKNRSRSNKKKQKQKTNPSTIFKSKCTKFERNMISEDYLYSIKQSSRDEELLPPSHYLKQDDMLINICIYDAVNREKQHQLIFLGDMKLTQLKKEIYCVVENLQKERINNDLFSDIKYTNSIKKQPKNQLNFFLFQENLYYQGTHHSQQQVDNLMKMIKNNYQTEFHKFSMNNIQLKNLRVLFGRPYLYRHIGGCDHMIVFKDIRLFSKETGIEPQSKKKYPLMVFESKMKRRKCQGCETKFAALACKGDKLKNGETSYLCRECHQNMHNDLTNPQNKLMIVVPYLHQ